MLVSAIFNFLTGIGILLFGVHYLGGSKEKLFGANFRKKMNKFASNRFSSFGFGALITFALQSSTASTAIFVSFASAGIITLFQAIGLIIGCNVGTALSSFLLAFQSINLVQIIASFVLIGVLIKTFSKKNVLASNIGNAFIGFGILFVGLVLIDFATAVFKSLEGFSSFLLNFTNPFLLILIGTALTIILQSSLGTFAVIISLMASAGTSGISIISACYLVYGVNIGTCLTSILAGLSSGTDGKRVAFFHLLFNLIGTLIFTLITLFTPFASWMQMVTSNQALQLLIVNFIFNIVTAIITLPFVKTLKNFMRLIIRRSKKKLIVITQLELANYKLNYCT